MTSTVIIISLAVLALVAAAAGVYLWMSRRKLLARFARLNQETLEASRDASVGHRLAIPDDPETAQLAHTVNRLFDALSERDDKLRGRDRLFQDFARTLPEIVIIHDEKILLANDSAASLVGLDPPQLVGRDVVDLVKPAYRALFRKHIAKRLGGETAPRRIEIQLINGNQAGLWVETQSSSIDYRGHPAILTVARDVSYRKSLEVSLSRSKRQAQYTLESIAEGVITTDNDGRIDYMNLAAETLIGTNRDAAAGHRIGELFTLVDDADRRPLGDPVERCLSMRRRVNMGRRAVMVTVDGEHEHSVELTASPVRGPSNSISGAVVVFHDVGELRGLTRKMSYQATHDPLTGLINRREFERRLDEAMDTAHAEETAHMLFYMDLDRFKAVNDSCGHIAGDNMLREVAALIKDQVRDSDFVGRLGGDEFGALLIGCPIDKARQIATDICNAIADYRFVWKDKIFNIGISIGLVEISPASGSLQDVMSAADSACYMAKQSGRGQVHVYSARDEAVALEADAIVLGLPYEVRYVNIGKGEQFTPEFLAISPNNRMPAIVDPDGNILEGAVSGLLVILDSWPGQMRTVYGDHQRFVDTYFSTIPGTYFCGDGARRDEDGYYWITGRVDDVLNVSGHRMGTAEIESALVAHEAVAEAAVVGYPHDIKGEGIYAYVTLLAGVEPTEELRKELRTWVRKEIGPIASPDLIQWAPGLPKTRSGKIMRRILRKIAANDYGNLGDTSTLAEPGVVRQLIDNRMNR